jgi:hypothetical protein
MCHPAGRGLLSSGERYIYVASMFRIQACTLRRLSMRPVRMPLSPALTGPLTLHRSQIRRECGHMRA